MTRKWVTCSVRKEHVSQHTWTMGGLSSEQKGVARRAEGRSTEDAGGMMIIGGAYFLQRARSSPEVGSMQRKNFFALQSIDGERALAGGRSRYPPNKHCFRRDVRLHAGLMMTHRKLEVR